MMVVKVWKVNLFYNTPSKGITNQSVCSPLKILRENVLSYKFFFAALIHISMAPLCLAAAAAALRAQQQVFQLSGTRHGPLEGQCSVLSNTASSLSLCGHHPWSCLGRRLRVWFGKAFYMMFSIVI